MRFQIAYRAGEFARIASDALDGQVGKSIPVKLPDREVEGRIVAVAVQGDGTAAVLTIEVDDDIPELRGGHSGAFSPRADRVDRGTPQ